MKAYNIKNSSGNPTNNQIAVNDDLNGVQYFFSYGTLIAKIEYGNIILDSRYWDFSATTITYLNRFLREYTSFDKVSDAVNKKEFEFASLND